MGLGHLCAVATRDELRGGGEVWEKRPADSKPALHAVELRGGVPVLQVHSSGAAGLDLQRGSEQCQTGCKPVHEVLAADRAEFTGGEESG